jgi:hypothetical protein
MTYDGAARRPYKEEYMAEPLKVTPISERKLGEAKSYKIDWEHPKEIPHEEVEISLGLQDTVHWYCDKLFRVTMVGPNLEEDPNAPMPPFYREFPDDNREFGYQVNSGPARPHAMNHKYKAHFELEDGTKIDPHIRVGP